MRRPDQYYFNVPVDTIKSSSYRPDACCAECKHFFPTGQSLDSLKCGIENCSVLGSCHRNAPRTSAPHAFPQIAAVSFCGDFEMVIEERLPFAMPKW